MFRTVVLLIVLLTWFVPAGFSHASIMLEFASADTGQQQSSFVIAQVGGIVDIRVYLRQTAGELDGGLLSAGILVRFDDPNIAKVVNATSDIDYNVAFDDPGPPVLSAYVEKSVDSDAAGLYEEIDFDSFDYVFPVNDRILVGTFRFTGQSLGTTIIRLEDLSVGDEFVTGILDALDSDIDYSATASVTVTPEPGTLGLSLGLFAVAATFTSCRARRKQGRKKTRDDCPGPDIAT